MERSSGNVVESKAQSKLCGSTCQQWWRAMLNPLIVLRRGVKESEAHPEFLTRTCSAATWEAYGLDL